MQDLHASASVMSSRPLDYINLALSVCCGMGQHGPEAWNVGALALYSGCPLCMREFGT